jgi:hypothetical protein
MPCHEFAVRTGDYLRLRVLLVFYLEKSGKPMATPRQIDANRRNAQKSTGPRTKEGTWLLLVYPRSDDAKPTRSLSYSIGRSRGFPQWHSILSINAKQSERLAVGVALIVLFEQTVEHRARGR